MAEIKSPKKLIEVALPLDDINEASGKEVRSTRPSLHFASLVGKTPIGSSSSSFVRPDG